uniref:Chemerin-like receptor 2 n=2 Tax=Leptobrachium leishanense TaxID=445787 RepID=A0A8C5QUG4_9ANUR
MKIKTWRAKVSELRRTHKYPLLSLSSCLQTSQTIMDDADKPLYHSMDRSDNVSYSYDYYYDFEEPTHEAVNLHALHVVSIVIYSVAFLLGVPGNAIVIWFTAFKWDKTVSTLWFLNLAIADLIFVFFLPLHITYVATNFHWPFGKFLCKVSSFIAILNMFASVFFLTVIGLDRFLSLARPGFSQRHRTLRKSMIVSGIIWILASIIAGPALYFRDTMEIGSKYTICYNNFHNYDHTIILRTHMFFTLTRFSIGYLFPLITMIICYTFLAIGMKNKNMRHPNTFFWTVLAIIVAFFICWTPFHIFSLLELKVHHSGLYGEWLKVGMPISTSLAFINSCVNPILYVLISKVFRKQLKTSMTEIFKNTLKDMSQTAIKSEQSLDSENNPTSIEAMNLEQIKGTSFTIYRARNRKQYTGKYFIEVLQ